MRLSKSYVDGFLADWGDNEYQAQVKMLRSSSRPAKLPVGSTAGKGRGARSLTTEQKAQAVRERLDRTARRVPEVMVKIYSSCKGMRQAGRHMDYISRKGALELEDQDGSLLIGKDELTAVKDEWRYGGVEVIGDESHRRDTLNIVFSMPAHTNEIGLKRAVREFAGEAFEGHRYVMAYHTPTTDPDPEPPDHPHIHLSVKVEGEDGHRMNPRKADLQRWREGFAAKLRTHGIEANATSRLARLKRNRGANRAVLAIKSKGEAIHSIGDSAPDTAQVDKAKAVELARLEYDFAVTHILAQSEIAQDRELAMRLLLRFKGLQVIDRYVEPLVAPSASYLKPNPLDPDR
jgi:hypothetical protein